MSCGLCPEYYDLGLHLECSVLEDVPWITELRVMSVSYVLSDTSWTICPERYVLEICLEIYPERYALTVYPESNVLS